MEKLRIYMLDNGVVCIKQDTTMKKYFFSQSKHKKELFDGISREQIDRIQYIDKSDMLVLKSGKDEICISQYKKFSVEEYFKPICKELQSYNKRKIQSKMKLVKSSIATGLVALGLGIGVLTANSINRDSYQEVQDEILYLEDEEIANVDFEENVIYEEMDNIEPIEFMLDENTDVSENDPYMDVSIEEEKGSDCRYFDKTNFESFDDIVKFAANMYNVDYNIAKDVVEKNMDYIMGPTNEVTVWMPADRELDRIKDLKEKGIIDPDIVQVGIFITIKNYAYDHKTNSGEIIISDKTVAQKEQDIIDIAKNIYGITNERLLANILAIHRLETFNGTSDLAINKNNQGGNRNADLSFVEYKTFEIGAESMIRNFLNNYSRALYDDNFNYNDTIEYRIAKSYCETPEEWANVVYTNTNLILETGELSKYLDNDTYKRM